METIKRTPEHLLTCCIAGKLSNENPYANEELQSKIKTVGVYILILSDGKHIYIGSSGDLYNRKFDHIVKLKNGNHKNKKLQQIYDSLNDKRFLFSTFLTNNREQALLLEQNLLEKFKKYPFLTNIATNAFCSLDQSIRTPEFYAKIALKNRGKKRSEETRKKLSIKRRLRITTEETKKKISESNKGKVMSEEAKEKIRQSRKNFKHSEETKKRMSLDKKNNFSDVSKINISIAHERNKKTAIINGIKYLSLSEAAKAFNISIQTVTSRIKDDRYPEWRFQ